MNAAVNITVRDFVKLRLAQNLEDFDFRVALEEMIQNIIETQFSVELGAIRYQRSKLRENYRNGHRKKNLITGFGELNLKIPKCRRGSFFPSILNRYERIVDAVIGVIQEAYIHGVSTRNMKYLYKELLSEGLSRSTISRHTAKLLEEIEKWNNRQLSTEYEYIWLDGKFTKKRHNHQKQSVVVLHGLGLTAKGEIESLGYFLANKENESNWRIYLKGLQRRGLKHCKLWIRDEHKGLTKALDKMYSGQLQQRCIVHWIRNVLDQIRIKDKPIITLRLKEINNCISLEGFNDAFNRLCSTLEKEGYNNLVDEIEYAKLDLINFLQFPESHWSKIKSTNPIERLNEELERRFKTIPIFPTDSSIALLGGSILMDVTESWRKRGNYMNKKEKKIINGIFK